MCAFCSGVSPRNWWWPIDSSPPPSRSCSSTASHSAPDLLFATLALFTMLYFDFSAYTDMARGTAALFGVRLTENFILPMAATSIADFWRTWHITLSSWVRDYVYIPLGGMQPRGFMHQALVLLITMGLVGLWHGANWTYVVWGLQHGVMMVLYQLYFRTSGGAGVGARGSTARGLRFAGWALTMAMHAVGMVWFFSPISGSRPGVPWPLCHPRMRGAFRKRPPRCRARSFSRCFGLFMRRANAGGRWREWRILPAPLRAACYAALFFIIVGLGVPQGNLFVYFQF